jgi:hypothetical protein
VRERELHRALEAATQPAAWDRATLQRQLSLASPVKVQSRDALLAAHTAALASSASTPSIAVRAANATGRGGVVDDRDGGGAAATHSRGSRAPASSAVPGAVSLLRARAGTPGLPFAAAMRQPSITGSATMASASESFEVVDSSEIESLLSHPSNSSVVDLIERTRSVLDAVRAGDGPATSSMQRGWVASPGDNARGGHRREGGASRSAHAALAAGDGYGGLHAVTPAGSYSSELIGASTLSASASTASDAAMAALAALSSDMGLSHSALLAASSNASVIAQEAAERDAAARVANAEWEEALAARVLVLFQSDVARRRLVDNNRDSQNLYFQPTMVGSLDPLGRRVQPPPHADKALQSSLARRRGQHGGRERVTAGATRRRSDRTFRGSAPTRGGPAIDAPMSPAALREAAQATGLPSSRATFYGSLDDYKGRGDAAALSDTEMDALQDAAVANAVNDVVRSTLETVASLTDGSCSDSDHTMTDVDAATLGSPDGRRGSQSATAMGSIQLLASVPSSMQPLGRDDGGDGDRDGDGGDGDLRGQLPGAPSSRQRAARSDGLGDAEATARAGVPARVPVNRRGEPMRSTAGGRGNAPGVARMRVGPFPMWFGTGDCAMSIYASWCLASQLGAPGGTGSVPAAAALSLTSDGSCEHLLCAQLQQYELRKQYAEYVRTTELVLSPHLMAQPRVDTVAQLWRQLVVACVVFGTRVVEAGAFERGIELLRKAEMLVQQDLYMASATRTELSAFVSDAFANYFRGRGRVGAAIDACNKASKMHTTLGQWDHVRKSARVPHMLVCCVGCWPRCPRRMPPRLRMRRQRKRGG